MTDIFTQLENQHKTILKFLDSFDVALGATDIEFLKNSLNFIESYIDHLHHGIEEEILFPEAEKTEVPKQGGAHCTKYFGLFLERRFLEETKDHMKALDHLDIPKHHFEKEIEEIIKKNSPLKIPLEDHESGFYLKHMLKREIEKYENSNDKNPSRLKKVGNTFSDMLKIHIEKEDKCLFPVLVKRFDAESLSNMSKRAQELEKNLGPQLTELKGKFPTLL
jgi:hemerythrin-like domain-containing protein